MPKLSDVIELAVFGLNVTHELEDGKIAHKATATYHFPVGVVGGPIEIDFAPTPGVTIVIVGAEVAPK